MKQWKNQLILKVLNNRIYYLNLPKFIGILAANATKI